MGFEVPVISLGGLDDQARKVETAHAIGAACRSSGFFQVVDHGVSPELIDQVFDKTMRIFALPLEQKMALLRNPHTNRGYDVLAGQSLAGSVKYGHDDEGVDTKNAVDKAETTVDVDPDLKEGWMIGPDNVDENWEFAGRFGHGPNRLPTDAQVPGVRQVMAEYYDAVFDLTKRILRLVALSLDLDESAFDQACYKPAAAIRLLHYPPNLDSEDDKEHSKKGTCGQHTDFSFVTALLAGGPGLQVWTGSSWLAVDPAPGAYIINVGDMLALFTGNEYKSCVHRVINDEPVDRYSVPFFMDGSSDLLVGPTRGPMQHLKPVTVEQHLMERFAGSYFNPESAKLLAITKA